MLQPTPKVTRSEDGTTVCIALGDVTMTVRYDDPFGPDMELLEPLPVPSTIEAAWLRHPVIRRTLGLEDAQVLWSVLTVALMAREDGYTATRLRQLEGEEVLRQEHEHRRYVEEEPC
jgi:hypothetical protein